VDFLAFCSFIPHRTFEFNFSLAIAAPSRRARSLAQAICGCTPAYAAVGASDDAFLANEFSERDDAIRYQFRVLDARWLAWRQHEKKYASPGGVPGFPNSDELPHFRNSENVEVCTADCPRRPMNSRAC
jgi:hypothetical protein